MIKLCYWEIEHWKRQIKGEGVIAKDSEKHIILLLQNLPGLYPQSRADSFDTYLVYDILSLFQVKPTS